MAIFSCFTKTTPFSNALVIFSKRALTSGNTGVIPPRSLGDTVDTITKRKPNRFSLEEAVRSIKSGDHIFVQGAAATPTPLLNALCDHAKQSKLKNVILYHMHLEGEAKWAAPEYNGMIRSNCLFIGGNVRQAVNDGRADAMSIFLSETVHLFRRRHVNLDSVFIQVSPPDRKGFCSLGTSIDCTVAAVQNAKHIIAIVNKNMPRTFGDGVIHSSRIDTMVEMDFPLPERKDRLPTPAETIIGKLIADNLVEDGATLQMGIGNIPDATLGALTNHKDLGIHTEMFSDGILPLVECSAITNAKKNIRPGKTVASFVVGSKRLYDFLDDNPLIVMGDVSWVNDSTVIRQNPKVTAINSCIEVDITGQVVSDSIGTKMYSGFGGQIDYLRGASLCTDLKGKPILALPSTTKKGESKIVPFLKQGAGVVTTRAHVHYLVTEHGIASLFGKNMRQRTYELIKIAHPNHREALEKAAYDRLKCMPSAD